MSSVRTDRLILRPFSGDDLPHYAAMNADPEIMAYLGGPITPQASWAQMEGANQSWRDNGFGKIAVERAADGTFMGMCGLSREPWDTDLELGWRLARPFWGQGFASEAARAWLAHGFENLDLARIISIADVPNARSIAVMTRIGMTFDHTETLDADGDVFEAVFYAITARAWRALPKTEKGKSRSGGVAP